jgi:hypothetical protein
MNKIIITVIALLAGGLSSYFILDGTGPTRGGDPAKGIVKSPPPSTKDDQDDSDYDEADSTRNCNGGNGTLIVKKSKHHPADEGKIMQCINASGKNLCKNDSVCFEVHTASDGTRYAEIITKCPKNANCNCPE